MILFCTRFEAKTKTTSMRPSESCRNSTCSSRLSATGGETTMPTFSDISESACETFSIRREGCAPESPARPGGGGGGGEGGVARGGQRRAAEEVVNEEAVALVGRPAPRRGVRLLD